nr:putative ribonuclease H-like domain-containing protein [Tanacetum cinerariifolium]
MSLETKRNPLETNCRGLRDKTQHSLDTKHNQVLKMAESSLDTRLPLLDRTDFASWKQWIRLYCRGKENGVNILKSYDQGPYQMGTVRETLAESTEGAPQFGPERPRVYSDLTPKEKDRYNVDIRATNILLQGLPKDIYTLINHYTDVKDIWDNVKMLIEWSGLTKEDRESQPYDDIEHFRQQKVQVYVDDIIFGSTKKSLCDEFEQMMHKRFQMISIGEITFFLGLQVTQKDDGIFISQDKYVADILKKFDFTTVKTASSPMEPNKALIKDAEAEDVDVH